MKKVGYTTVPFRYDLNQIPYDYTVEVRKRFKGLDLTECLMKYGQRFVTLYRRQGIKTIPMEKKCKKAKWLSEYPLQPKIEKLYTVSKNKTRRGLWLRS